MQPWLASDSAADLVCIYGGDRTIYHVINEALQLPRSGRSAASQAVSARWRNDGCDRNEAGMSGTPSDNGRAVISAYRRNADVSAIPLLRVRTARQGALRFTFGMGPLVRILDRYERGQESWQPWESAYKAIAGSA